MARNASVKNLGRSKAEKEIKVVTLTCGKASAELWSYGARIHKLSVPTEKGSQEIIKTSSDPIGKRSFAGAAVGRVANIIKKAQFEFEGNRYMLEDNFGGDHIHGGTKGFHAQNWRVSDLRPEESMVRFYLKLTSSDDGYPGTIEVTLTYRLDENGLSAEYRAQSRHDTLFAPTIHPFFNLSGSRTIMDHKLTIPLQYLQRLDEGVPKGRPVPVKGWNDLQKGVKVEKLMIGPRKEVLNLCWIRDGLPGMEHLCTLSVDSGLELQIHSTMPALQVYTSNTLKDDGLRSYSGIALEPEYPPDSANRVMKNRILLKAGNARREVIAYRW